MERVSTHRGTFPAIIVVPHGFDDPNTAVIAEAIVAMTDAYAVINHGWERADNYDYFKDKANCNNILHIHNDVVREEFLEPIINYTNRIYSDFALHQPSIFIIHGVSNLVRKEAGDDLDMIIGYGEGGPPSYSCDLQFKDAFADILFDKSINVYQGKAGGKYSARRRTNLNQLFRSDEYLDELIFSLQLEVVRELREDEAAAKETGMVLGEAIKELIETWKDWTPPCGGFDIPQI